MTEIRPSKALKTFCGIGNCLLQAHEARPGSEDLAQKLAHAGYLRSVDQLLCQTDLVDDTFVKEGHSAGKLPGKGDLMGGRNHGSAPFGQHPLGVQNFVQQHVAGFPGKRPANTSLCCWPPDSCDGK